MTVTVYDGIALTDNDAPRSLPLPALQVDVGTDELQTRSAAELRSWCSDEPEGYAVQHDERFVMVLYKCASSQDAAVGIWDTTTKRWVYAESNSDAGSLGMLFDGTRGRFIGIDRVRSRTGGARSLPGIVPNVLYFHDERRRGPPQNIRA